MGHEFVELKNSGAAVESYRQAVGESHALQVCVVGLPLLSCDLRRYFVISCEAGHVCAWRKQQPARFAPHEAVGFDYSCLSMSVSLVGTGVDSPATCLPCCVSCLAVE